MRKHHFLISFIHSNQPQSIEVEVENESLSKEDALPLILNALELPSAKVTDIQVIGIHHDNDPKIHPGHYQQSDDSHD